MVVKNLSDLMVVLNKQRAHREYKIKAWSDINEYPIMFSLVFAYQIDNVIECGTCGGASAATWALALNSLGRGKVDTWDVCNKKKVFEEISCGFRVEFHNESFCENAELVIAASKGKRLFFIDGGHLYDEVYKDTSLVLKYARTGDVLVVHDAVKIPDVVVATTGALSDSLCVVKKRYTIESTCGFEVVEF